MSFITREDVCKKLFKEIAPKYAERNGGYTSNTNTAFAVFVLFLYPRPIF